MKDMPTMSSSAHLISFNVNNTNSTVYNLFVAPGILENSFEILFREEIIEMANIIIDFVLQVILLILHSFFDNATNKDNDYNQKQYSNGN